MTAATRAADGSEGGGGADGGSGNGGGADAAPADPGGRRGWTPEQVAYIERLAKERYGSLNGLAQAMAVSHGTVYKWKQGLRGASQRMQRKLAEVLGLPWPTDFLPPPADTPAAGPNVYGSTREVYGPGGLGLPVRPVYRAGTRQDLAAVGVEQYPLPATERPVPPERARQIGADAFVLLHSGGAMEGRRPEPALDGDLWWVVPVRPPERVARPGDLVAARVEDAPPGAEAGVLLRGYDADPATGAPVLYAEPVAGLRVPVAGRWTVLGVALFVERIRNARDDM